MEKEINMDDKEATPVEDLGEILPPTETNRPVQPEGLPERTTQTGDTNLLEMIKRMMGEFNETLKNNNKELKEELCQMIGDSYKKLREDLKESFKEAREKLKNDSKPETGEIPKDENMEQVNPKTEEDRGIKNQITKKTEERCV